MCGTTIASLGRLPGVCRLREYVQICSNECSKFVRSDVLPAASWSHLETLARLPVQKSEAAASLWHISFATQRARDWKANISRNGNGSQCIAEGNASPAAQNRVLRQCSKS